LSIPGSQDGKSTTTPGRKKRSMGIRALSAKQRRDDTIRARLKEHIVEISDMLNTPKDTLPQVIYINFTFNRKMLLWRSEITDRCVKL